MSATLLLIADDVVSQLNAATTFALEFVAERRYQPRAKLTDLENAAIFVRPMVESGSRSSRNHWEHKYDLEIGILKRLVATTASDEEAETDGLYAFSEAIVDFWKTRAANTSYLLDEFTYPDVLSEQSLNEQKVCLVRFTMTFKGWRAES